MDEGMTLSSTPAREGREQTIMTTQTTLTTTKITQLRAEAGQAGDAAQVALCDIALRSTDAWWAWHDADYARAYADMGEADAACAEWVAGTSTVGPDVEQARAECARVIADAQAQVE